jgi:hypothetical protein
MDKLHMSVEIGRELKVVNGNQQARYQVKQVLGFSK